MASIDMAPHMLTADKLSSWRAPGSPMRAETLPAGSSTTPRRATQAAVGGAGVAGNACTGHDERARIDVAFNRLHAADGITICSGTVQNWIKKHSVQSRAARSATRNRLPAFAPANRRWCLDGTGKADASGIVRFILGIIDHGSRFAPVLQSLEHPSAWAILAKLFDAIDRFGKPHFIRTDNAPVFHSRVFRSVLAAAGISHEFTQPGKPWQNGRIERFFLTLKLALNRIVPNTRDDLDSLLDEFRLWYNDVRPHQHLHGFTPGEVWRGVDPYAAVPKQVLAFKGWDGLLRGFYLRR